MAAEIQADGQDSILDQISWFCPHSVGAGSEPFGWVKTQAGVWSGLTQKQAVDRLTEAGLKLEFDALLTPARLEGTTGSATLTLDGQIQATEIKQHAVAVSGLFEPGLAMPLVERANMRLEFDRETVQQRRAVIEVDDNNPTSLGDPLTALLQLQQDQCCSFTKCPAFDRTKGMTPVIDQRIAQAQIGALAFSKNQLCRKGIAGFNDPQQLAISRTISNLAPRRAAAIPNQCGGCCAI